MSLQTSHLAFAVRVPAPHDAHYVAAELADLFGQRHHALDDHTLLFAMIGRPPIRQLGKLASAKGCMIEIAPIPKGARVTLADGRVFEAVTGGRLERQDRQR